MGRVACAELVGAAGPWPAYSERLDARLKKSTLRISRTSKIVLTPRLCRAALPVGGERREHELRHRPKNLLALRIVDLLAGDEAVDDGADRQRPRPEARRHAVDRSRLH